LIWYKSIIIPNKNKLGFFEVLGLSDILQKIELKISSDESCQSKFKRYINTKRQICDESVHDIRDTCSVSIGFGNSEQFRILKRFFNEY
jgi:hypothetical protein